MVITSELIPTQIVSLVLIVLTLVIVIPNSRGNPDYLFYFVPVLVWFVFSLLWYGAILVQQFTGYQIASNQTYIYWGAAIRLMSYLAISIQAVGRFLRQRVGNHGQ